MLARQHWRVVNSATITQRSANDCDCYLGFDEHFKVNFYTDMQGELSLQFQI